MFGVLLVPGGNLSVAIAPACIETDMEVGFNGWLIEPFEHSHLIFTGETIFKFYFSSTLSKFEVFVRISGKTEILIVAVIVDVENGSVEGFKFLIKSFSDLGTLWAIVTQST